MKEVFCCSYVPSMSSSMAAVRVPVPCPMPFLSVSIVELARLAVEPSLYCVSHHASIHAALFMKEGQEVKNAIL